MNVALTLFMYAAGCGLILSIVEHTSALMSLPSLLGQYFNYLFFENREGSATDTGQ
jgi:hypothetical protein